MATGHDKARWRHTSAVLALLANCHRDPKSGRTFEPHDFDPHAGKASKMGRPRGGIELLKVFLPRS